MLSVPWAVVVNGRPMTDRMNPYIERIECTDKAGETSDSASLVFDDSDGQCVLPPKGATIQIELDGVLTFDGFVDQAESVGARGSGMQLNVSCTAVDKRGKAKERQGLHKDDATLEEFLQEAAKKAGIDSVKVDPDLGKMKRPYWSTDGRSFLQLGRELAEEYGATFKIKGKKAVFAKRGNGTAPGGGALPSVSAIRGDNLISWRLQPYESRPRFSKVRVRHFDRDNAKWEEEEVEVGSAPGAPEAVDLGDAARAALQHLRGVPHLVVRVHESLVDDSEALVKRLARERGFEGRLIVLGEPDLAAGDARMEWADGGVVRDRAQIEAAVLSALGLPA